MIFFLLSKEMQFLCTRALIITYKNQALLLALGGWLEEKKIGKQDRQISGYNKRISGEVHINIFVQCLKIYLSIFLLYKGEHF